MAESKLVAELQGGTGLLVLGMDTCGASGTVALARIEDGGANVLGQKQIVGRTYSATLVSAIAELLAEHRVGLRDVSAIVVVNGPGSFTGVRVGLSAVKGLAEPGRIPVVAVSRLAVLAAKAGVGAAALDGHRHEVFLRIGERELLAGAEELSQVSEARCGAPAPAEELSHISEARCGAPAPDDSQVSESRPFDKLREGSGAPSKVAVCDDAAAEMVGATWSGAELVRVEAPTAEDAIGLCVPRILLAEFEDLAVLDGHYLRRSDAEIFGEKPRAAAEDEPRFTVRRMVEGDVDRVVDLAARTHHAPGWQRQAYVTALDPDSKPRRIALVAEEGSSGELAGFAVASVTAPEAELESIVTAAPHERRGVARELFSRLKAELRRQGVHEVMLEVRAGNHGALGFYRFLGFAEEGRRPGYYSNPVEDAVLMSVGLK